ncbi:hypothetical protein MBAV_002268 [Candidatus Magnetobacterium bavaricum]|uniref:Uncharacterized protein n=1 Tax=Candidatus Magnetobacterium bavaricum TaxID=29290 RepID=A0A0F3GU91_9BACT|nr:hypothetical protein MBAV_002268 [Candidatus Magnetobacterium bavaricum]
MRLLPFRVYSFLGRRYKKEGRGLPSLRPTHKGRGEARFSRSGSHPLLTLQVAPGPATKKSPCPLHPVNPLIRLSWFRQSLMPSIGNTPNDCPDCLLTALSCLCYFIIMEPSQKRYWAELTQLRVHIDYLDIYLEKTVERDKWIDIIAAVTSSSSIALWAIWQEWKFVWGFIIAVSQVITAIKDLLPYKRRVKMINGLMYDLEDILHDCEKRWFDISIGELT